MKTKPPRVVLRPCENCDYQFNAATDYEGFPHAATRRYCEPSCARLAANGRRREKRAHRAKYLGLIRMHRQEAAGQMSIVLDPLPPIPEIAHTPRSTQ